MAPLVVDQVSFRAETDATIVRTMKRTLILVDSTVGCQSVFTHERLRAIGEWAYEWLRTVVSVHVAIHTALACKLLITVFELTLESFVRNGSESFVVGRVKWSLLKVALAFP